MTFAICQKCGSEKFGAVNHCPNCGYCPMDGSDRDVAIAMLFSDHYMSHTNLISLGRDISAGVHVELDNSAIDVMTQQLSKTFDSYRNKPKPSRKWWQFWKYFGSSA
jgi:hypothetical protein